MLGQGCQDNSVGFSTTDAGTTGYPYPKEWGLTLPPYHRQKLTPSGW